MIQLQFENSSSLKAHLALLPAVMGKGNATEAGWNFELMNFDETFTMAMFNMNQRVELRTAQRVIAHLDLDCFYVQVRLSVHVCKLAMKRIQGCLPSRNCLGFWDGRKNQFCPCPLEVEQRRLALGKPPWTSRLCVYFGQDIMLSC